jgi:hypothetical protein
VCAKVQIIAKIAKYILVCIDFNRPKTFLPAAFAGDDAEGFALFSSHFSNNASIAFLTSDAELGRGALLVEMVPSGAMSKYVGYPSTPRKSSTARC